MIILEKFLKKKIIDIMFKNIGIKSAVIGTFIGAVCYQAVLKVITFKDLIGLGEEFNSILMAITLVMLVALKRSYHIDQDRRNI